jgi:branched-chain amino acid transport system permease protein
MTRGTAAGLVIFAVALILALTLSPAQLVLLNNAVVLALFAMSTNLVLGTAGLVSFGQACFYGIGSYAIALAWFHRWADFWVAALIAPALGAAAAFLVGALALRSRRWFFALLTMAFSQLFFTIAQKAYDYTQGDGGIFGPMLPPALREPRTGSLFIVGVAALAIVLLRWIDLSPLGLTLRAIRENQRRAAGLGVNVYGTQLLAFTIAGGFAAAAGVLNAVNQQAAYPGMLDWVTSGDPVLVAVIGGMRTFLGPMLGAVVYQLLHDVIVQLTTRWQLALGLVLLAVVMLFPDGLAALVRRAMWGAAWRRLRGVVSRRQVP